MRSSVVFAAALALSACTQGPSDDEIQSAQNEFKACATAALQNTPLQNVKAELTGLSAPIKPAAVADFSVSGGFAPYEEKIEIKKKEVVGKVDDAYLTFTTAAGAGSAKLSGYNNSIANGGANISIAKDLKLSDGEIRGIKVGPAHAQLQQCANTARATLNLTQG